METVSEKKRGRPSVFDREELANYKSLFPDITTHRGLVAKAYEIEAVGALTIEGTAETVPGVERIFGSKIYKATILEHLGRYRIESDCPVEAVQQLARQCNQ